MNLSGILAGLLLGAAVCTSCTGYGAHRESRSGAQQPTLPDSVAVLSLVGELVPRIAVGEIGRLIPESGTAQAGRNMCRTLLAENRTASFRSLRTLSPYSSTWVALNRSLCQAIVDTARTRNLPWQALDRSLAAASQLQPRGVPVAAFLAVVDGARVWIILRQSGIKHYSNLEAVAYGVDDDRLVCEERAW